MDSDIEVTYTQRKSGRTVTHFIFTIESKEEKNKATANKTVKKEPAKIRVTLADVNKNALPGESYDDAFARLRREQERKQQLQMELGV